MEISAAQVKELRKRTGVGFMDCKKALAQTGGDIEAAIELMRKMGQMEAGKKASRVTAEGIIKILINDEANQATILEANCETDFVARENQFQEFVNQVVKVALQHKVSDVAALQNLPDDSGQGTVEEIRHAMVAKIGENVHLRRVAFMETANGVIGGYVHGNRIGVLVKLKAGNATVAKDIAMHIAANKPLVISPNDVSNEEITKEKEIYLAQAEASGKPANIIEKMVEGRINKFRNEVSLLGQPFVKDAAITVAEFLKSNHAEVEAFIRYEVGEGIERRTVDFVAEVMSQAQKG